MINGRRWVIVGFVTAATVLGATGIVAATTGPLGQTTNSPLSASITSPSPSVDDAESGTTAESDAAPSTTAADANTDASGTDTTAESSPQSATSAKPKTSSHRTVSKTKVKAKPKAKVAAEQAPTLSNGSTLGTGRIQFGATYTGRGTFYGATGAGNCSFDASSDLMVGAMNQQDYANSQACGAFLSVTGPSGTTIKIRVVDRCPECPPGAIDLSAQAFAKLADPSAGIIKISWKLLSPALSSPVSYRYKSGSSTSWCGIQVLNHRNPIRSMQLKTGSGWTTLARQDYNYFLSEGGAGCGGTIRITDIYGNQLTDSGIGISPDAIQRGHAQFGPPR